MYLLMKIYTTTHEAIMPEKKKTKNPKSDERSRSKYEFTGTKRREKTCLTILWRCDQHTPDCGKLNRTKKQVSSTNKLQSKKKKKDGNL